MHSHTKTRKSACTHVNIYGAEDMKNTIQSELGFSTENDENRKNLYTNNSNYDIYIHTHV